MQTLTITDKKELEATLSKAADRARVEKPIIRKTTERGVYEVESRSNPGKVYTVRCNSTDKTITCNCPAVKPCKHIAAVAPFHSFLVSQEAGGQAVEVEPVETLDTTCSNCGTADSGFAFDSQEGWLCGDCLQASEESRLVYVALETKALAWSAANPTIEPCEKCYECEAHGEYHGTLICTKCCAEVVKAEKQAQLEANRPTCDGCGAAHQGKWWTTGRGWLCDACDQAQIAKDRSDLFD